MSRKKNTKPAPVTTARPKDRVQPAPPARRGLKLDLWVVVLLLILGLSAALGFGFARATPVGAAPDEAAHVEYVRVLATQSRLPQLNITQHRNSLSDVNYEAHQSPLYYALAVPFFAAGHSSGGDEGAAQGCRVLSIILGLFGTAAIWVLARELAPERPALWTAAAAFAAFLPMRLHVNASVTNDPLAELTCTVSLILMLRALRGSWTNRQAVGLGVALAVALLAKQSNLMLFPSALLAVFLASRPRTVQAEGDFTREGTLRFLRTGVVVMGVVLLLSGWWFARNAALYGDPLAQKAFDWYFSDTPTFEQFKGGGFTFADYMNRKVIPVTFDTFWGAFGYLVPTRPDLFMGAIGPGSPGPHWGYPPKSWLYPWLWLAVQASLAGGGIFVLRSALQRRRTEEAAEAGTGEELAPVAILAIHGLFVFAAFLRFNTTYFQAQGRYLFPAIGFFALALVGGWLEWPRLAAALVGLARPGPGDRKERGTLFWELPVAVLIVAGMLAMACYALFGVVEPGFKH